MRLRSHIELRAESLMHGVRITGFPVEQEEWIRATVSRVPSELMATLVKEIRADRGMGAKHGNYDPQTKTVRINPHTFQMRQRYGRGPGWIQHIEMTMVHEFGHALFESLTEEQKQDWYDLSGWVKAIKPDNVEPYEEKRPGWEEYKSKWTHKKGVQMTRHYGEKNPNEHFADCFAFYLLGKPNQMAPVHRLFMSNLIRERVRKYPKALIEGPTKTYQER